MEFWRSLITTVAINVILSGDNALMVALATHRLPQHLRKKAILWAVLGAALLQIAATFFIAYLITIPYLETVAGILLAWVAVKLLRQTDDSSQQASPAELRDAIKNIMVINLFMSLDNSLGVASASNGNTNLLIISLIISIPVVIFCSGLIQRSLQKWPIIIIMASLLLGYMAGKLVLTDAPIRALAQHITWVSLLPVLSAAAVFIIGKAYKIGNLTSSK